MMKKMFALIAVIGGFCILGAAGMADTFTGEQMFTRLLTGVALSVVGGLGVYICKIRETEQEIARRVALIRG